MAAFRTRIAGIPCQINVTSYEVQRPIRNADSDCDARGYAESTWEVLDRRGYQAAWLERKLTPTDEARIEREIAHHAS